MSSLFDLSGRVALVTGAASGMGRASSLALAEHGARLLLVDRHADGLAATADEIARRFSGECQTAVCDISAPEQIDELFARLDARFGRIDFLANIAGDAILAPPEEITRAQIQQVLDVLVLSRFQMCQLAGRRMLAARSGSILNIGSIASLSALGRGHIAYSMAMAAVVQMTRELSTEWSRRGVRVNAILPAQTLNPSLEQRMAADPTLGERWLRGIPRGRLGEPRDIAGLAVLLASEASNWITGAIIPLDGGNLAMNAGATIGPSP